MLNESDIVHFAFCQLSKFFPLPKSVFLFHFLIYLLIRILEKKIIIINTYHVVLIWIPSWNVVLNKTVYHHIYIPAFCKYFSCLISYYSLNHLFLLNDSIHFKFQSRTSFTKFSSPKRSL